MSRYTRIRARVEKFKTSYIVPGLFHFVKAAFDHKYTSEERGRASRSVRCNSSQQWDACDCNLLCRKYLTLVHQRQKTSPPHRKIKTEPKAQSPAPRRAVPLGKTPLHSRQSPPNPPWEPRPEFGRKLASVRVRVSLAMHWWYHGHPTRARRAVYDCSQNAGRQSRSN